MKNGQTIGQWLNWNFKTNGGLEIKDKNDNVIYMEFERESWRKREYDSDGNVIYDESSCGVITDNRAPQIITHNGRKYQLIPN